MLCVPCILLCKHVQDLLSLCFRVHLLFLVQVHGVDCLCSSICAVGRCTALFYFTASSLLTSCWLGLWWRWRVLLHGCGTVGFGGWRRRGGHGRWDCGWSSCWYSDRRLGLRCRESWWWARAKTTRNKAAGTRVETECCCIGIETCTRGFWNLRGTILPRVGHIGNDGGRPGTDGSTSARWRY